MASYDKNRDYMSEIKEAVSRGDIIGAASLEKERNAKIAGEGLTQYQPTYDFSRVESSTTSGSGTASDPKKVTINYAGIAGTPSPVKVQPEQTKQSFSYSSAPSYVNQYQDLIDQLKGRILEQDPFSYDAESDPLYQQYRTSYTNGGQRAMQDALGQLSARTGGMASSYAESAAQQTYDNYMGALADKIPELQQLAYSMYQDEGEKQRLNLQMIAALEQEDYAKYQDLLSQYNTDRSFAYNQYRDQIGDDRYADETAWNRGVYQDETDYNRGIYADETDYNRKQLRAKQLAETGDFSGYLDLGYSQEEVDRMQAAFFIQHPELAALNTTGAGGLAGNAALANTIGADSMGNAIYYDASGVGRYSDGTIYGGDPGGIPSYVLNNYAGGGSAKPWNKWSDAEDWVARYGADSINDYLGEHYKDFGYKSKSTAIAGWKNHLTETGGISAGGGGTSGGGTSGGGGGSGYSYSYTPAAQDSGDTGTITSVSQLGPEALRIINRIDPRPNYVSTQVQKGLANGTITEAEADYLLRAIGY